MEDLYIEIFDNMTQKDVNNLIVDALYCIDKKVESAHRRLNVVNYRIDDYVAKMNKIVEIIDGLNKDFEIFVDELYLIKKKLEL